MYKKCTSNLYIYTKNVQSVQNLYKVQTKNGLKLEMFVFCTYKQWTSYAKPTQLKGLTETVFVCFMFLQTMYKLYKIYANVKWIIFAAADVCFFVYKTSKFSTFRIFA